MFGHLFEKQIKRGKVVLLGDKNVGKTSLLHRWNTGQYDHITFSTINHTVVSKLVECDGVEIRVAVWDTFGRDDIDTIPEEYFAKAKVAILCFDIVDSTSFHNLSRWAEQLINYNPHCKVCICATKADLLAVDGVRLGVTREDIHHFTKNCSGDIRVYYTSSKTGEGIDKIFHKITKYLVSVYDELEPTKEKKSLNCLPCLTMS